MDVSVVPKKAEKTKISEAIREEIIRIATEGSVVDDGALTPSVLSRIQRVAMTGRDVLVAMSASQKNLAALIKHRRGPWGGNMAGLGDDLVGDDGMEDGYNEQFGLGNVLAPSPMGENFGMTALRELIAGMKQVNTSPDRLVEALATARREGLHDVAKKLEGQLGLTEGAALPPTDPTSDVKIKISFPNGEDGNDIPEGLDDDDQPQVRGTP